MVSILPVVSAAINVIINMPGAEKRCVGYCPIAVLAAPEAGSPKSHDQLSIESEPVCQALKSTESPEQAIPQLKSALKQSNTLTENSLLSIFPAESAIINFT